MKSMPNNIAYVSLRQEPGFIPWPDRDIPSETIAQFERHDISSDDFNWLMWEDDEIPDRKRRKWRQRGERGPDTLPPIRVRGKRYKPSNDDSIPWDDEQ
jgi:hypothetical protein